MPKRKLNGGQLTSRGKRALSAREPKLNEGDRALLTLRGPKASSRGVGAMRFLAGMKKGASRALTRKNDIRPFEDLSSLEFLSEVNGCSAFALTSHTKKRPDNIVLGRLFDGHVLDQFEFGVVEWAPPAGRAAGIDGAPLFIFQGDAWAQVPALAILQNLLLDVFGARAVTHVALEVVDHVSVLTAVADGAGGGGGGGGGAAGEGGAGAAWGGTIHWRVHALALLASGGAVPRVELAPAAGGLTLRVRRAQLASPDLRRAAQRKPAGTDAKRVKNVTRDELGATLGRVHMERQDMAGLKLKKTRALKAELRERKRGEGGGKREEEERGGQESGGGGEEAEEEEVAARGKAGKRARTYNT